MRKLMLLFLVLLASNCFSQDLSEKSVLVSTKSVNSKPILIYVSFNDNHFISMRKGKETYNYELKSLGSHMNMGQISVLYQAYINGKIVKGLQFRTVFGNEPISKKWINQVDVIIDDKEEANFELKEI